MLGYVIKGLWGGEDDVSSVEGLFEGGFACVITVALIYTVDLTTYNGGGTGTRARDGGTIRGTARDAGGTRGARGVTLSSNACATRFAASDSVFRIGSTCSGGNALAIGSNGTAVRITLASARVMGLFLKATGSTSGSGTRLLRPAIRAISCKSNAARRIGTFSVPIPILSRRFSLTLVNAGNG